MWHNGIRKREGPASLKNDEEDHVMLKKIAALVLSIALCLSLVSFAVAEDVPNLANTYYTYGYDVGFYVDYFFHFYDEIPGFGKVFYAGWVQNQASVNGTYEVIAEEREYACWPDRVTQTSAAEGDAIPTGTAPYTIVFYGFDGKEIDRCAFDGEHLYNDMANLSFQGCDKNMFTLEKDIENSKCDWKNEKVLEILNLVDEDELCELHLKLDGTYEDVVIMVVDGTYAMNEDKTVITLTPNSTDDFGAVVTRNEDGTYTYVSNDESLPEEERTVILREKKEAAPVYLLKGQIPVPGMDDTNADFICELYDDNTALLYADFMGTKLPVDQGTYEIDMTTYSFTIHFETAGDLTTEGYAADMVLNYKVDDVQPFGAIEQTLKFVTE